MSDRFPTEPKTYKMGTVRYRFFIFRQEVFNMPWWSWVIVAGVVAAPIATGVWLWRKIRGM